MAEYKRVTSSGIGMRETKMLGRTAPRQRRNQEKSWPRFTRQLRLDLRPGDMRWRQRPETPIMYEQLSCSIAHSTLGQLSKHQHLSIGAGIATGWAMAVLLADFDCPSNIGHAREFSSGPSILEGRRDLESIVHFFKITLALIHLLFLSRQLLRPASSWFLLGCLLLLLLRKLDGACPSNCVLVQVRSI
jgi:hypothetical protein